MIERQMREKAVATASVPGYVMVAAALLMATIAPFTGAVYWLIAAICLIAGISGLDALRLGYFQPDLSRGTRVRLAVGAMVNLLVLWGLPLWFFWSTLG